MQRTIATKGAAESFEIYHHLNVFIFQIGIAAAVEILSYDDAVLSS